MLDPAISNRRGCIAKEKLFGIIPFFMCPIGMVAAAAIGNTCDTECECGRGATLCESGSGSDEIDRGLGSC
jgi:hypothetical protein